MELTILGAGPAYSDRRGSVGACYLVESDGAALVLDLGQGSFPNLASTLEPSTLLAVVVSHLHPDHFIDLVPLRHYLRFQVRPPRRMTVHAPAALPERLDALHGQPGFSAESFDVVPTSLGCRRIGPFEVEAGRVTHTDTSYGFRVSAGDGPGLVYSGDCGRADDLLPLIRPGDVLLCEASFGAGPVAAGAHHLTAGDAGRIARDAGAGRLLMTHLQMGFDPAGALAAARAVYAGPSRLVLEGDRFEI